MRALTPEAEALLERAVAGEQIIIAQLVQIDLDVPQRLTTAGYPLQWGGYTWAPVGVAITPVENGAGEDGEEITISLPAVTGAQLALALVEPVAGRTVAVRDALIDPATGEVVDAPLVWRGRATVPSIQDGAQAVLSIACETNLARAWQPKPARYTSAEQLRLYPGDTSLHYDPATDAGTVVWPAASAFRI